MEKTYNVEIDSINGTDDFSDFSKREILKLKDTRNCLPLDKLIESEPLVISPKTHAILNIHNEKAKDEQDYQQIVIVDNTGTKYITGSKSFMESFIEIDSAMMGDEYEIEIFKLESKNYSGKKFITCSIV